MFNCDLIFIAHWGNHKGCVWCIAAFGIFPNDRKGFKFIENNSRCSGMAKEIIYPGERCIWFNNTCYKFERHSGAENYSVKFMNSIFEKLLNITFWVFGRYINYSAVSIDCAEKLVNTSELYFQVAFLVIREVAI